MLQPRAWTRTASSESALSSLAATLNTLSLCVKHQRPNARVPTTFVRCASHAAQGRANGPKDSAGRRLGAKKTTSEFVVPGNIIFKQRGTLWFPGENCGIGKDHTIYALAQGYVRYYRDPLRHPKRRFIGVALAKEGPGSELPTPPNAPTPRRLGMYAAPIHAQSDAEFLDAHLSSNSKSSGPGTAKVPVIMREGTFREANVSIGRAAERKGIKVRPYDRGDRWLAWRKRAAKVKESIMAKAAKGTRKTKAKKSNKAPAPGSRR